MNFETDAIDCPLRLNEPHIVAEVFGDEVVVLDTRSGRYFSLTGSAAIVWFDLAEGHTPRGLIEVAAAVGPKEASTVKEFMAQLVGGRSPDAPTLGRGRASHHTPIGSFENRPPRIARP